MKEPVTFKEACDNLVKALNELKKSLVKVFIKTRKSKGNPYHK